jgi:DNA-binding MarR family transcriptional regulator
MQADSITDFNETSVAVVPDVLSNSAGYLLGRTTRILRERVSAALKPLGITPRQLSLLKLLAAEGGISQQELGKRHDSDRTTIVQLIDELESRQLVVRVKNGKDRRSNLLHLTPRGRKTLSLASRLAGKEQVKFLAALDDKEWAVLRNLLLKLLSNS